MQDDAMEAQTVNTEEFVCNVTVEEDKLSTVHPGDPLKRTYGELQETCHRMCNVMINIAQETDIPADIFSAAVAQLAGCIYANASLPDDELTEEHIQEALKEENIQGHITIINDIFKEEVKKSLDYIRSEYLGMARECNQPPMTT